MSYEWEFLTAIIFDFIFKLFATEPDGNRFVEVYPSVKGRATQFDKDVLIYVISQMTAGINQGREDAKNRTIRVVAHDLLVATNRPTGGESYHRLTEALERLRGTTIKTDITTGGERIRSIFGLIESADIIEKNPSTDRMIALEVTLSKWLYNAIQAHEVLTTHPDYFRLRSPIERRVYELVRKHCGQQSFWQISLDNLREKSGAKQDVKNFRRSIKNIINADSLPEYKISINDIDLVSFQKRDHHTS